MLLRTQLPLILPDIRQPYRPIVSANKIEMIPNSKTEGIYIFVKLKVKHYVTKATWFPEI